MDKTTRAEAPHTALGFYHKISHLRADTWNALTNDLADLELLGKSKRSRRLIKAIRIKLTRLEIIEDYHAFPSSEDFRHLWLLFNQGEYAQLGRVVNRLVRALVSESYRRRPIDLSDTDAEDVESYDALDRFRRGHPSFNSSSQPYFEVLLVDNLSSQENEVVRDAFYRMRRAEDRFVYDVVTVRSFEDALIAPGEIVRPVLLAVGRDDPQAEQVLAQRGTGGRGQHDPSSRHAQ